MVDPVVPLVRALYGHPDAGGYWEQHCDKHLRKVGFKPANEGWPGLYVHEELNVLLMVYVDDFKAAGTPEALKKAWSLIKSGLDLDEPGDVGRCLGCHHRLADAVVNGKNV